MSYTLYDIVIIVQETITVCMSCGSGAPNDNHGDNNNITLNDLDRATRAANIERDQAADNIMNCCQQQRGDQGGVANSGETPERIPLPGTQTTEPEAASVPVWADACGPDRKE